MSIKSKVGLILLIVFALFGIIDFSIQRFIVLPGFESLERDEAIKNVKRAAQSIQREIHHLDSLCHDWSAWDETYEFILSRSDAYIESNLVLTTFTDNSLNLLYFMDMSRNVVWGEIHNLETEEPVHLSEFTKNRFPESHPLSSFKTENKALPDVSISGIFLTEKGPMLVAARPILNSNNDGPIRGTIIMGKFLNESIVKTLSKQTEVDFQIFPIMKNGLPVELTAISHRLEGQSDYLVKTTSDKKLNSYAGLSDIEGNPAILIKSELARKMTAKGEMTIRYAMYLLFLSGAGVFLVVILIIKRTILSPIAKLTEQTLSVGRTGDLSKRLSMKRRDEIGVLAREFDKMLEQLLASQKRLENEINEHMQAEEEKGRLQTQLQRAQKMEAIGTLAGGVAHDLNNVLSGIVSYPDLLLLDMPQDDPLRKPVLTIKRSGEKAASIVQDLLAMARRGVVVHESTDLNSVVSDYLQSPEYQRLISFHPHVQVKADLEQNLFNIVGSSIHMTKTVMNLVSNAAEAMPDGGEIVVSTKNRYIDTPIGKYEKVEEGEYVVLSVHDNGIGIAQKDLDKIFEPFYTKKVMGRSGTGLGMAVVWGTIRDHNGYIDVQSTKGNGTIFTLYFPVTRLGSEKQKLNVSIEDCMGSKESVLVVDDVAEQREITCAMLNKLNYSAVSTASGEEAVEYLKSSSVDIVLLDMIMDPGIDGLDTYRKILELHPGQKAIIASGFSETDRVKETLSIGAGRYIRKPYILKDVGIAIKEELRS